MTTVHILFDFVEGPWGGGNQFLKALRGAFRERGVYTDNPTKADVVLVNSHHKLETTIDLKRRKPNIPIVHRIDGPVYDIRGRDKLADEIIYDFNDCLADGTIFQSDWSRDRNRYYGLTEAPFEATILNAPDTEIFNSQETTHYMSGPVRIIASSWSDNMRKGFDIYQYLDKNLDFDRFEFTFVGNSPVEYDNVNWINPVPSKELADYLKQHHIYITASRNDPCSNALIEALHCGLPAVARDDGGHPEIIEGAGELFTDKSEVIPAIETVAENLDHYRDQINIPTMTEVSDQYYTFLDRVATAVDSGSFKPKTLNPATRQRYRLRLRYQFLKRRVQNIIFG